MSKIHLTIIFYLFSIAFGDDENNYYRPNLSGRIRGGNETKISNHPYMVSVHRRNFHACGGALITKKIVITSQSCIESTKVSDLSVRIGSTSWRSGARFAVKAVEIPCTYDSSSLYKDLAIIHLDRPAQLGQNVRTIPIADESPNENDAVVLTGWGIQSPRYLEITDKLHSVELTIISRDNCSQLPYKTNRNMPLGTFCAVGVGKFACVGDYGGPLVSKGHLIGIYSDGYYMCGHPDYCGVYIDVSMRKNSIQKFIHPSEDDFCLV